MSYGETVITIVGNLTDDPELRFTPAGPGVASFTIASTPRTFDKTRNEWKDGDTLFLRASAWRELGEHVTETLAKGTRVIATGRLKQRSYEDREGIKRTVVELDVEEIGPSLRYATAKVTKATRSTGGAGNGTANGSGWGTASPAQNDPWQTGTPVGASAGGESPF
jgi:single-strand DNA-binding protein